MLLDLRSYIRQLLPDLMLTHSVHRRIYASLVLNESNMRKEEIGVQQRHQLFREIVQLAGSYKLSPFNAWSPLLPNYIANQ